MKIAKLRALVAGLVAVVIAVGYFTQAGIGNLSGFGFDVFSLLCPLGYIESLLATKILVPRALISFVGVVLLVIVLGRVFCSWVCPMPFLQKLIPGFKGKKKGAGGEGASLEPTTLEPAASAMEPGSGKSNTFKLDSRHGVLAGALASAAIFGFPVFCLICPVGLSFATVYLVMRLFAFGETTWTVIAVPLFLLIEVVFLRKWCSKICPLGAVIFLISGLNKTFRPTIDNSKCLQTSKGISCEKCTQACPENISIRKPEQSPVALNNCTKCHECSFSCPAHAITFPFLSKVRSAKNEVEKEEK